MGNVSLEKRTEAATASLVSLLKKEQSKGRDLGELTAQVIIVGDYSGSMSGRYANGEVQTLVERCLALSLSGLDDDGNVQVFFFHHSVFPAETVNQKTYQGFVNRWMSGKRMGGTNYVPAISEVVAFADANGMTKPGMPPIFVLFVTDGEPGDKNTTTDLLANLANRPIFWQFLGLGYSPKFLKKLDKMRGRVVDNVGLTEMRNTLSMSDGEFFDEVIREFFSEWLPAARAKGITR